MPDAVLDYHRLKTPIDHPDNSVTGIKLSIDIVSTITPPTTFPGLWGFSGKTMNAILGKVMPYWGAGINTEDKFWLYFFAASDEGNYRRLCNTTGDRVSVIGSPSISLNQMAYGLAIYLYRSATCQTEGVFLTDYVLSDIDIYWIMYGTKGRVIDRSQSTSTFANLYCFDFDTGSTTADYRIVKYVNWSETAIATEAVDLSTTTYYKGRATLVGSTLSFYRDGSLRLQVTDTTFTSGVMGLFRHEVNLYWMRIYRKPYGTVRGVILPKAIIETEIEGSGKFAPEDPYRPKLNSNLKPIESLNGLPEYLYKQKENQQQVDLDSVTYGGFEIDSKSPTNIIMIYDDNPYKTGAIQRQIDYTKSKNMKVFNPPKNYDEAISLYNQLKTDFGHWLAGKDNFAYMCLGLEELNLFQNIDFYYGELIEHKTHYNQLKQVPDWELLNRFRNLMKELSQVSVLTNEREKHLNKLKEILKKGW